MDKFFFKYTVSIDRKRPNHIKFKAQVNTENRDHIDLYLPKWRPGRYEIANYAQYIKNLEISSGKDDIIYEKIESSIWRIHCSQQKSISLSYSFYSNRIDAGFSYADENQIYLNPVNCFFYVEKEQCDYEITFKGSINHQLYAPLKKLKENRVISNGYDELFDSPMIYSNNAYEHSFKVKGYKINNVFQGECEPNIAKIEKDFSKFIDLQIECFGKLPVKEFSFLNQITSHRFYHGVEHCKNTVLAFGPGYLLDEQKGYENFLGLACHEFYHIWNVKHLRPRSLFPYDFSRENTHHIGYIIEGVTTYQGDLKLWQSKVFDDRTYFKLLAQQMSRHLNNPGRFNQSVRESSVDLWLDGYQKGVQGKKVSIYTEGALIAFIVDVLLLEQSKGYNSLDTVMKRMFEEFALKNKAYSEEDYSKMIVELGGRFYRKLFDELISKPNSYEDQLSKVLKKVGLQLIKKPKNIQSAYIGIETSNEAQPKITAVIQGSPAESAGMVEGMTIHSLNGMEISKNLDNWLTYFFQRDLNFIVSLNGNTKEIRCQFSEEALAFTIGIEYLDKPTKKQQELFKSWRKH